MHMAFYNQCLVTNNNKMGSLLAFSSYSVVGVLNFSLFDSSVSETLCASGVLSYPSREMLTTL